MIESNKDVVNNQGDRRIKRRKNKKIWREIGKVQAKRGKLRDSIVKESDCSNKVKEKSK